jgi:hypothetical protein
MNQRSLAIAILQKARDALGERLTQRILESEEEITADAEGGSYLSEIESIYDQLGGRLAHLNAMLSNLPPVAATTATDAAASEIIYADLASAYPTGIDLEATNSMTLLALPAPTNVDTRSEPPALADELMNIIVAAQAGELTTAGRLISELFDIKPSQARRGAQALARQIVDTPELIRRIGDAAAALDETNEYATATLLSECFEFQAIESLAIVRALKIRFSESESPR